jgi:hypothetical protein
MKNRIFISYSSEDGSKKNTVEKVLKKQNPEIVPVVVIDRKNPGVLLANKVKKGIEDAEIFLPILTRNSICNQWVNQEIGFAVAKNREVIAIVEKSIIEDLKGFIHAQQDLSFIFEGNKDSKRVEGQNFRSCCSKLANYLNSYLFAAGVEKFDRSVELQKLSLAMDHLFREFHLGETQLLTPSVEDIHIETHSHRPNGYFAWLQSRNTKKFSFKYWKKDSPDNYVTVFVDNSKPEIILKTHLDNEANQKFIEKFRSMVF